MWVAGCFSCGARFCHRKRHNADLWQSGASMIAVAFALGIVTGAGFASWWAIRRDNREISSAFRRGQSEGFSRGWSARS